MRMLLLIALALVCWPALLFPSSPKALEDNQTASADSSALADLATIRQRYVRSVIPPDPIDIRQLRAKGAEYAAALETDGHWPDIDYAEMGENIWTTTRHLDRTLIMAKSAWVLRNEGHADKVLENRTLLAVRWWTDHDYRNPNWWWNQIGVPELLGEIACLLESKLTADLRSKIVVIMKRADWKGETGANLTWVAGIQIVRGCLENDHKLVADGYRRMYREIRIVTRSEEGIQQDDSFHQHGAQLYNGGYGLVFANDVDRFVSYSWATRFQIPADRMALFAAYLLDGEQWMIRGNVFDYSAVGREITRPGKVAVPHDKIGGPTYSPTGTSYGLGNTVALLAAEPTPRQKELQSFAARLQGESGAPEFTGNKHFWCSDYMAHRRAGFFSSVKMFSARMRNGEIVDLEGAKSVHLSDGVNFLYLTGDEYKDIFPVWDWTKLPGTTAIQGTLETGEPHPVTLLGKTTFDGGVSDGTYGMAAMDLRRGKLSAKKAWFFFDDSYVALGAGITLAGDSSHDVATDVNQTLLEGEVSTNASRTPLSSGTWSLASTGTTWVYHNRVGYIFPLGARLTVSSGPQTGSWSDIGPGSKERMTARVFNLWIDHGRSPRDGTYQYIVLPNVSTEQVAMRAANPELDVLSNTSTLQAVYNSALQLVEIAFRMPGQLATPLGSIEADHSCLLMVRQVGNEWRVTASNPENRPLELHLTVKGKRASIELPDGNLAGSSVTAEIR